METLLIEPSVVAIYFFRGDTGAKQAQTFLGKIVASDDLKLQKLVERESVVLYGNQEKRCWLDWLELHDVIALRLFLAEEGQGSLSSWRELRAAVLHATGDIQVQPFKEGLLGASILYWGSVDATAIETIQNSQVEESLAIDQGSLAPPSQLEYGPMWKLRALEEGSMVVEYALLCLLPLIEQAKREFFFSRNFGFFRVELHLHQAYDSIATYQRLKEPLYTLAGTLENDSAGLMNILESGSLDAQEQALRTASVSYGKLMETMSRVHKLLVGLRANVERYEEHLRRIPRKSLPGSEADLGQFSLSIRQIELDLDYGESTARGVQTSISLLRAQFEINSARREVWILAAVGVLAAVIAVGQVVGELTADWRVVAGSIIIVVVINLGAWLAWHLFRRSRRRSRER